MLFFSLIIKISDKKIKDFAIRNSKSEKLLGVTIDSNFSVPDHITDLCSKASQKIHTLFWEVNCPAFDKK